jgi:predicted nucleic acid-binding protein
MDAWIIPLILLYLADKNSMHESRKFTQKFYCCRLRKYKMLLYFSESDIQKLITSLFRKFTILELSRSILSKASQIREKHSFSFWDSIVAASALDCGGNNP